MSIIWEKPLEAIYFPTRDNPDCWFPVVTQMIGDTRLIWRGDIQSPNVMAWSRDADAAYVISSPHKLYLIRNRDLAIKGTVEFNLSVFPTWACEGRRLRGRHWLPGSCFVVHKFDQIGILTLGGELLLPWNEAKRDYQWFHEESGQWRSCSNNAVDLTHWETR